MKPKFYTYKHLIKVLNSIPAEYDNAPIVFTVNWDGNDYCIIDSAVIGRKKRLVMEKINDKYQQKMQVFNQFNKKILISQLSDCRSDFDINIKLSTSDEFYTLSTLNYSVGQNVIYFCIRRVG
jgi:hypothetical protein